MPDPAPVSPQPPASGPEGQLHLPPGVWISPGAIALSASRSSGPGGQNVNKVSTRMELRLPLAAVNGLTPPMFARLRTLLGRRLTSSGEARLVCQQSRSQEMNRQGCLDALAELIHQATQLPPTRRATRPSRASRQRRLESKRHRSDTKSQRRSMGD